MELTPDLIARTLKKRGRTQAGLAKAMGVGDSAITSLLQGTRDIKAREVPIILRYLDLDTVPLVGRVSAGLGIIFLPEEGDWKRVPAPPGATEKTVAVEIVGTSLGPMLEGWLAFYDRVERPITKALLHHLCVVGLPDGSVLIKRVEPSRTKGLFHLYSNTNEPPILDQEISWAAQVKHLSQK